jgi:DNA-binding LacI/PurR family transcriptional regulator
MPTVLVDAPAWPEHGAIAVDDAAGARAAAGHLLDLGHRELLVLALGPVDNVSTVSGQRMLGYREALAAHGVALEPGNVRDAPATFDGGESAFTEAWSTGARPTGVLAMSDAAAAGVLQAARQLGLSVPEDLSSVGFDDLPLSRFTDPPLTTVHQPVRYKGAEAARMLIAALNAQPGGASVHRVLETHLVVRSSTGRPD